VRLYSMTMNERSKEQHNSGSPAAASVGHREVPNAEAIL